jgi:hypothetical protein
LFIDQLASVRMLPWATANLNPTGQALIICTVAGLAYFVAGLKKTVETKKSAPSDPVSFEKIG